MTYDIIIVGAGPSGSTAAKFLAEKQISVLLIDRDVFPRHKPCAGGLCRHIHEFSYLSKYLQQDNPIIKSICKGSIVYYPIKQHAYTYTSEKELFYNVFRNEFDDLLVKQAIKSGATFIQKAKAIKVDELKNKVSIQLSNGEIFKAKAIIGADGPNGLVGRFIRTKLGYEQQWKKQLSLSVLSEIPISPSFIENTYGKEKRALVYFNWYGLNSYAWVFPKYDTINIGYAAKINTIKKIDMKEVFHLFLNFLKEHQYLPTETPKINLKGGFIPLEGPLKKTYHDRMLLIGDAAGFVSPLSGEGIYYAMDSGRIAAKTLEFAYQNNNFQSSVLQAYHKECMNRWGKNLILLKNFRKILLKRPDIFLKIARNNTHLKKNYADIFNGNVNPMKAAISIPYLISVNIFRKKTAIT